MTATPQPYRTEQEAFWAGAFGTEYIQRNQGDALLASNLEFFSRSLRAAQGVAVQLLAFHVLVLHVHSPPRTATTHASSRRLPASRSRVAAMTTGEWVKRPGKDVGSQRPVSPSECSTTVACGGNRYSNCRALRPRCPAMPGWETSP